MYVEMQGCSLCVGNFNNRPDNRAQLGRIPSRNEYLKVAAEKIDPYSSELYRYLNFDQIEGFEDSGRVVSAEEEKKVLAGV